MCTRYRSVLLFAVGAIAVLCPTAIAVAACPLQPPPPCGSAGLTGRVGTSLRCGHRPPPACHTHPGPRGQQGAKGETGAAGKPGARGADGATGASGPPGPAGPEGLQGVQGEIGATGSAGSQGLQGVQGEVGAAGETGATGSQGDAGSSGATGAQGEVGLAGKDGLPGEAGATGSVGPAGSPGPAGETGQQGTPGAEGSQGPAGTPGATGPTGPAGSNGLSQYAYIYNLGAETVPLEGDVTFDSNGVLTPGITHALGAAGITLTAAGTYEVTFSVSGTEPSQMALFVNGTLVPGTVYGSGAGTQQNTGQAIFVAPAGAVLTVRNHTSSAAVGLATPIGGTQPSSNASVVIEKLS